MVAFYPLPPFASIDAPWSQIRFMSHPLVFTGVIRKNRKENEKICNLQILDEWPGVGEWTKYKICTEIQFS